MTKGPPPLLCAALLAGLVVAAAPPALAQSQSSSSESAWGKPADLKPLIPPLPRVFIPPNSAITSGSVDTGAAAGSSLYDPTRDQATPGLRFTIPTR
jgi:hypothetical protein